MGDRQVPRSVLSASALGASALLLDLDGTLYVAGAPVPGAPETVAALRGAGIPFRFVTNTTSRPRTALVERLRGYGFSVHDDELLTPVVAGARIARAHGCSALAPFLPAAALADLAGFELMGGIASARASRRPDAVLVGDLAEQWSYALMQEAFEYVLDGALFIALSRDRYWRRGDAIALDAGPFVAGLEYAASRTAMLAGKPSPEFFGAAVASLPPGLASAQVAMIGDDLWSDVRGAQDAGLRGWLVRTGKFREDALRESGVVPDRILASVADLRPALEGTRV
ncbi:MAG TPA: HAD-IIA family hydrolase [Gemmatimonadales bacterium]|nr:HAD-IIA family hydrolase [Gemmatimonadales bacterium]